MAVAQTCAAHPGERVRALCGDCQRPMCTACWDAAEWPRKVCRECESADVVAEPPADLPEPTDARQLVNEIIDRHWTAEDQRWVDNRVAQASYATANTGLSWRRCLGWLATGVMVVGALYGTYEAYRAFFGAEVCSASQCAWVLEGRSYFLIGVLALLYLAASPVVGAFSAWPFYLVGLVLLWLKDRGQPIPHRMSFAKRVAYFWQLMMSTFGKSTVQAIDMTLFVLIVVWCADRWGIIGAGIGLFVAGSVGAMARGLVMVVTGALVSVCIGLPAAIAMAVFLQVEADAVAPALE